MKITKYVHSCLLVEMPDPVNRTVLFDPGTMSEAALDVEQLQWLDDIIITHRHTDHFSVPLIKQLVGRFPAVRITSTPEVVDILASEGITANDEPAPGVIFFDAPHAEIRPYSPAGPPQQIGVHYLGMLTDPGDSHEFSETKEILALPVQAPWGSTVAAVRVALDLKPHFIIPVHDWHWSDEARIQAYDNLEAIFRQQDITFIKPVTGEPFVLDV